MYLRRFNARVRKQPSPLTWSELSKVQGWVCGGQFLRVSGRPFHHGMRIENGRGQVSRGANPLESRQESGQVPTGVRGKRSEASERVPSAGGEIGLGTGWSVTLDDFCQIGEVVYLKATIPLSPPSRTERVLILDFGSQYTQVIARRIREASVFS